VHVVETSLGTSCVIHMDFFSLLNTELSARRTWMPNIESLDFINNPIKNGPYQEQQADQLKHPNTGMYGLKLVPRNKVYLEYENRLCDILNILDSMEPTSAKEDLEDRVYQELVRINCLKEVEWSDQRSKRGIKGAVVNTGMFILLLTASLS
jgi:hypothetical protein